MMTKVLHQPVLSRAAVRTSSYRWTIWGDLVFVFVTPVSTVVAYTSLVRIISLNRIFWLHGIISPHARPQSSRFFSSKTILDLVLEVAETDEENVRRIDELVLLGAGSGHVDCGAVDNL